ncbi:(3R)-hydroxymyristoyl-[acyl-carrier-protein] dehydratase [Blastochloris viridis]|uniref:(3R)-hydroxymyristoyl-[acyl-carrier-protein] dehydratase n=1 Tax=Blastochloris viridis TaxID=1079 RepID=A0A0S4Q0J1_BLAVI|nr:(3R)-hydroxymyristoyl-[acyl-carrier-protein] dehydratase [Blastochloris viridis]
MPMESTVFEGHFPGYPLMPGVLLCETMAQTCGWLSMAKLNFTRMAFLAGFKDVKLRTFVTPGAELEGHGQLLHEGSGFTRLRCQITCGGKTVCDSELSMRLMPFPDDTFKTMVLDRAKGLSFPFAVLEPAESTEANNA